MLKKEYYKETLLLGIGLFAICWLSYGYTVGKMGYFLDDWYIIWTYRTFGAAKFVDFFKGDRPLLSYIYRIFFPILKDSIIGWQLLALFSKWLTAITLWILMRMILPHRKWFSYAVAALFAVYPGFKFHYFSIMYSLTYILLAIYLLSFILMILALHNPKKRVPLVIGAMICQFIGVAPQEYFFGFELVRPILIYLSLPEENQSIKPRILQAIKAWLPYLIVLLGFTFFRIFRSNLYSYQIGFIDQFKISPLETLITLVERMMRGLLDSCLTIWTELAISLKNTNTTVELLPRLGLIVLGTAVSLFLLYKAGQDEKKSFSLKKNFGLVGLGIFAIMTATIPFLVAGFTIDTSWSTSRFLLSLSVGVSLLTVSILELIVRSNRVKFMIIALLIGLSIEANHANGLLFLTAWNQQTDFFAQLTWRVPQIKPGTVIITPDLPFEQYFSGGSLTAPLNMIYAPELSENPIPYQLILAGSLQMNTMPDLIPDQEIYRTSRVFTFKGNTSDMITIYYPDRGCLQVIPSDIGINIPQSDQYSNLWEKIIPLSDLSRIETNVSRAVLPVQYFGDVKTNQWCYYFQRASLAEQDGMWESVVEEYKQAEQHGLTPVSSMEWLPLIRASLALGEIDNALDRSSKVSTEDPIAHQRLCAAWEKYYKPESQLSQQYVEEIIEQWHCEE